MTRPWTLLAAPVAATLLLFVAPLAVMVLRSVSDASGSLTITHYSRFAGDAYYLRSLGLTAGTAALVTAITLVCAFPVAYGYWQARGREQ